MHACIMSNTQYTHITVDSPHNGHNPPDTQNTYVLYTKGSHEQNIQVLCTVVLHAGLDKFSMSVEEGMYSVDIKCKSGKITMTVAVPGEYTGSICSSNNVK